MLEVAFQDARLLDRRKQPQRGRLSVGSQARRSQIRQINSADR
jgi:hypothetical protein